MSKLRNISLFFILTFILSACNSGINSPEKDIFDDVVYEEPKVMLEEPYGIHEKQIADIFLPANRSNKKTKVLVIIHGGGWYSGSSKDMEDFAESFRVNLPDYAIVNMNYRLVDLKTYMLPTQIDDINMLLYFISENERQYGVRPEFDLLGLSAGAHLSMLYAYKFDVKRHVKHVVNIVGPTNLTDEYYTNSLLYPMKSLVMKSDDVPKGLSVEEYASPITWISKQDPPTISFYGKSDILVPSSQGKKLEEKLNKYNIENEMYYYDGGHSIGYENISDVVSKTISFLKNIN